jgi:hypothetical protein
MGQRIGLLLVGVLIRSGKDSNSMLTKQNSRPPLFLAAPAPTPFAGARVRAGRVSSSAVRAWSAHKKDPVRSPLIEKAAIIIAAGWISIGGD